MTENGAELGMIGLGVMGRNLLFNIGDHGHSAAGYDRAADKVKKLTEDVGDRKLSGSKTLGGLIKQLKKPRVVMMLVPAGDAVDKVIEEVLPLIDGGDLIVDGGNSKYTDTDARTERLIKQNIHFFGMGISGGEKGARYGPSMMPGGHKDAYKRVQGILEAVAAKVDNDPCVTWLGPRSAGHYVKMVHNGIEYGIMQLIAETYDLMKRSLGLTNRQLHETYKKWNEQELSSYLVEITAEIFTRKDDETDNDLVDMILDEARQKGTGKWTSQDAMDLQVPVPTIDAAVAARDISGYKSERKKAVESLHGPSLKYTGNADELIGQLRNALYFAMITTYAQGMSLLRKASDAYKYDLKMADIARIWRGGCIIRAALLEDMRSVYTDRPDLADLMMSDHFAGELNPREGDIRQVVSVGSALGIPMPAFSASLAFFDAYRSPWSPANLTQAQRDYFGSHTYERIDKKGTFHTEWQKD